MPFYEIIHHTKLTTHQRETLAQGITSLHSTTFSAPSFFVNIKFSSSHNASVVAPSAPAVPEYFIAGHARQHPNVIFAHVRGGGGRSKEAFNELAERIESLWDEVVGVSEFRPTGHPAETNPPQVGGEEKKAGEGKGTSSKQPEINWNDERRLQAVYIVPGLIAREAGFSVPEAGGEREWIQNNMELFKKRAQEGDTEMKRLVDDLEGRSNPEAAEQEQGEAKE